MEGKASLFFLSLLFLHFPKNHSSLSGAVTLQFCFFFFCHFIQWQKVELLNTTELIDSKFIL